MSHRTLAALVAIARRREWWTKWSRARTAAYLARGDRKLQRRLYRALAG